MWEYYALLSAVFAALATIPTACTVSAVSEATQVLSLAGKVRGSNSTAFPDLKHEDEKT